MKKTIIISAVLTVSINAQAAFANLTEAKQAGAFFTSSLTGAALGGPVGLVVGALGGIWLGEELRQADSTDQYKQELSQANSKIENLNTRLVASNQLSQKYAAMAVKPFELQMLFKTNQSELTEVGKQRVSQIAEYLANNEGVSIQLDGYADPRGTTDDNMLLSKARVIAIIKELEEQGLSSQRIFSYSHGSALSQATEGDHDAYALERVVKIKMFRPSEKADVAQNY